MKPPALARRLLERTLPPGVRGRAILGDLLEELHSRSDSARARRWFWRQTLSLTARYGVRRLRGLDRAPRRREENPTMLFDALGQDLRLALRSWRRTPGFASVIVVTLALGIGASTAIFSLVDGILLRPLPYAQPERLVHLNESNARGDISVSWPNFLDWRERQRSFEAIALSRAESLVWTGGERAERLGGRRVTGNFFAVLGVRPLLGSSFVDGDDAQGTGARAIVSHAFWRQQLGADPAAIGRTLTLDGRSHEIVGVLPASFRYLGRDYDVFVPIGSLADMQYLMMRSNHQGYRAVGRLRPGVPVAAAEAEMRAIAAELEKLFPVVNAGVGVRAAPLASELVADVRQTLLVLLGAVGLLLLIACANVANLLVARGAARQHELGVRAALGCGRLRLIRQLLVESTLLSAAGGALGLLAASGLLRLFVAFGPEGTPRLDEVRLDTTALLFALGAAAVCGVLFGAFPALQASGVRGQHALVRARAGVASARSHRLRRGLLVVEVALALVLLAGAGLMIRTRQQLARVDVGFAPDHLLTARFSLSGERWQAASARAEFQARLLERLRAHGAFASAALTESLPIEGSSWNSVFVTRDQPAPAREETPSAAFTPVSEGFFETLGMRLVRGRLVDATDTASSALTVVVNESLARQIWPGEDPLGKLLKQGWTESPTPWRLVVGVVADVQFEGLVESPPMQIYLPMAQEPTDMPAIVVRTNGPPAAARAEIEGILGALDRDLPLFDVRTMDELLGGSIARQRMSMLVLLVFAAVAVTLAAVGLYGVVAHGVTERTREISIRVALGACERQILGLVVRQGVATALVGAAIGLLGALSLSRSIQSLLFGVTATDPWTLGAVVLVLLAVTAAACYLPARRATSVDPADALRAE